MFSKNYEEKFLFGKHCNAGQAVCRQYSNFCFVPCLIRAAAGAEAREAIPTTDAFMRTVQYSTYARTHTCGGKKLVSDYYIANFFPFAKKNMEIWPPG